MKKHIALFTLVTAALFAAPDAVRAADAATPTTPAATETKPAKQKNADATPYHGKVVAVDAATITVDNQKLTVTAATKISKAGKKAKLAEIAVGDKVHGSYKKDANGNLNILSLREGEKAGNGTKKKKAAKE